MASNCAHTNTHYSSAETFHLSKSWSDGDAVMDAARSSEGRGSPAQFSPNFEVIDGLLYRKKLEKGFINYREVLDEGRRLEALSTFHQRRGPAQHHLSLEETYKCVAENYWWDGMNITHSLTFDFTEQHRGLFIHFMKRAPLPCPFILLSDVCLCFLHRNVLPDQRFCQSLS